MTGTTEVQEKTTIKIKEISYDGIMPWKDVQLVIGGLSRVTVWRDERAGRFPKRVQTSQGRVGWIGPEIKNHIETRPRVNPGPCAVESGAIE